eukprot:5352598-Prymnesium_polylepis.1
MPEPRLTISGRRRGDGVGGRWPGRRQKKAKAGSNVVAAQRKAAQGNARQRKEGAGKGRTVRR